MSHLHFLYLIYVIELEDSIDFFTFFLNQFEIKVLVRFLLIDFFVIKLHVFF